MSLSWRERVTITLTPRRVTLLRHARGLKPAIKDRKSIECAPATDVASWRPAMEALREALAHPNMNAADATVMLSDYFVRYLLISWNAALAGEREELSFAAARFVQVYGDAAQSWVVRMAPGKAGAPVLAAAVERPFLDAVTALLENSPLRLRALQPGFTAACNARRNSVAPNAWIASAESGRLLLGLQRGGQWCSLRSRPLNGVALSLAEAIEQELLLLGLEPAGEKIYLHQSADANLDAGALKTERLSTFETAEAH